MKEIQNLEMLDNWMKHYGLDEIFTDEAINESRIFKYEKGEYIIEVGMPMTYLRFLVKGETKIFTTLENGKSYLLRIETPLRVYGDVELLKEMPFVAYVEALTDCYFIAVPNRTIQRHCLDHPPFLKYLITSLSDRLIELSYVSTDNILLPLRTKLAGFILLHLDDVTKQVNFTMSYTDIAEQLGTTYRHLSRTLKEFEDMGMIRRNRRQLRVLDEAKLEFIAGEVYRT